MNYEGHVLVGILTYPFAILIASLLKSYLNLPFELTFASMALGYGFYVLGSDLPDMDHPDALIHRGSKPIVSVGIGSFVFLRVRDLSNFTDYWWANLTIAWLISAAVAFGAWYGFSAVVPRHRGIIHTLTFALIYALISFLGVKYGLSLKFGEALFISLAAFSGYTLHLISDRHIKLI